MNLTSSMFCPTRIKQIIESIRNKTIMDDEILSTCTGFITHSLSCAQLFELHCHLPCCTRVWVYLIIQDLNSKSLKLDIINRAVFDIEHLSLIDLHVKEIIQTIIK